jgi:hypothetical protein
MRETNAPAAATKLNIARWGGLLQTGELRAGVGERIVVLREAES